MYLLRTSEASVLDLNRVLRRLAIHLKESALRLEPGFPLLVTEDGKLHWGGFAFLLDTYRVASTHGRNKTLNTYAEGLKSWLEYVEQQGADWTRPTALLLSNYRLALSGGISRTRRLASATVNLRTVTIREFYKFLESWDGDGLADSGGEWDIEPIKQFLVRIKRLRRAKEYKRKIRSMSSEETAMMAATLKAPHSYIFHWMLSTGVRTSTATSLRLIQLPRRVLKVNYIEAVVKGGKVANIVATGRLIQNTIDYCDTVRNIFITRGEGASDYVFINSRGKPVTPKSYYQAFKRAAAELGLSVHPHMTRHTFAVNMESRLEKMVRDGESINPIKVIQHLLAHNSAKTTEEYLASVGSTDAGLIRALLETEGALT